MTHLEGPRGPRRRLRRRRRLCALGLLLAPSAWLVVTDALRRGRYIVAFDAPHTWAYAGTGVAGALLWVSLLWCAALRRGPFRQAAAGVFAVLFTVVAGVQGGFHSVFNIYCSHDAQIYSRSIPQAVLCHLPMDRPLVIVHLLVAFGLALALLSLVRMQLEPGRVARFAAPILAAAVLVGVTQVPASYRTLQSSTPDIIYVHGFVSMIKERLRVKDDADELRAQLRTPLAVPALDAKPARPRNVLFILQESLRADVVCIAYDAEGDCATPFSNKAVPARLPFHQLRANASTTAITINNLWAGVGSHESLDTLLSAPQLWDFAKAAGYQTAYWTSQNVMFGSMRLYVQDFPVDHYAYATNLDTQAHYDAGALDALLTDWVIDVWDEVEEPFFAVVHYSNVHFPYVYDARHAPFQPAVFDRSAGATEEFFNYYKNVVYLSDIAVGRLLDHVRATDKGARTVIVYTSDHGEALREHWQLGHTSSLYDEEIKVPGWIDAPPETLSPEEEASLRGAAHQLVWHYDLHATMLDLLGVWDAPEIHPFREKMIGRPITRPQRTTGPVPLSNCSWLWECGFRNWGMMQGPLKLEARQWDDEFRCFDVLADPEEEIDLGEDACAPLADIARATFGPMPVDEWPDGENVLFGPAPPASARP